MSDGSHELQWAGERWRLLADRAVWRERGRRLILADPHFGKAATFRAAGINCPEPIARDLARLDALIEANAPEALIILGDLLHSRASLSHSVQCMVAEWRTKHAALEITLIRGNHDRAAGDPPNAWGMAVQEEGVESEGVALWHDVERAAGVGPMLGGHVHPAIVLPDAGRSSVRLPCFAVSPTRMLLPAFGSFTGMHAIRPAEDERIFVATPERVVPLPPIARRRRVRGG